MKPAEDIVAAVTTAGAARRAWIAPGMRRLTTSAAESAAAVSFDATEQLS